MRRQEAEKFDLRNLTGEARECLETLDSNSLVEFLLDYDADDFDTISEDAVEIFGLTMVKIVSSDV